MKKNLLTCLCFAVLFLTACGKKDCCAVPDREAPFITAKKNNIKWDAPPATSNYTSDTVNVYGGNFKTGIEDNFGFFLKINSTGSYTLKNKQGYYYNTLGRDVIVSDYKLDDTFNNTITVTTYDKNSKIIAGTFQMQFIKIFDNPAGSHADKVTFLDGKFKAALHN